MLKNSKFLTCSRIYHRSKIQKGFLSTVRNSLRISEALKGVVLKILDIKRGNKMVLQYKLKTQTRWKKYHGKDKLKVPISKCDFRLLNEKKTKILFDKGSYNKVMKRFRQIEFFKHKR